MSKLRIIAFALIAVLAVGLFAACKPDDAESNQTVSSTTSYGETVGLKLPDMNWGGRTVTVCAVGNEGTFGAAEWAPTETNDEPVNDATFERNAIIKEKYGIEIRVDNKKDFSEVVTAVTNNVDNGGSEYQIAATAIHRLATSLASDGKLYDLNQANALAGVDYLDLTAEWWDQAAVRDLSIHGVNFFATGDICVTDNAATWAVFFNKDIVAENGIEDLYQAVRDDRWTLDLMHQSAKQATKLDGNQMDFTAETDDTWGMVVQSYDGVAFMGGCAQSMVAKDEDDTPLMRILDARNVAVFAEVFDLLLDEAYVGVADLHGSWTSGIYGVQKSIFSNGHALFMPCHLAEVDTEHMRNADIRYGILPMPKVDELQEEYSSHGNIYSCTVATIPISVVENDDLPLTLFAMEAMAYYGREMVTDEYYEVTLKNKRFNDDDSPEMLDIISKNRTYDLSAIYDWGSALYLYTNLIGSKNNTLVSSAEKYLEAIEADLRATVEAVDAIR